MTVEILFPEVCNFFGDTQNEVYLRRTLENTGAEFVRTPLDGTPYFASETPALILIGSMSESIQRRVIDRLMPYKERISRLIDDGCVFLATGNSCDIFMNKIDYVTEKITVPALGLFPLDVKTDWFHRVNGKVIGQCDGITVTGFRSQFSEYTGDNSGFCFLNVERGFGTSAGSRFEGVRRNNFFGTQLLGPVLPLNPDFCAYILRLAGIDACPAFYDTAKAAYDRRVAEFRDPEVKF